MLLFRDACNECFFRQAIVHTVTLEEDGYVAPWSLSFSSEQVRDPQTPVWAS